MTIHDLPRLSDDDREAIELGGIPLQGAPAQDALAHQSTPIRSPITSRATHASSTGLLLLLIALTIVFVVLAAYGVAHDISTHKATYIHDCREFHSQQKCEAMWHGGLTIGP